jgi:ribosomal protein S18 acetylase RimI-like enzyme
MSQTANEEASSRRISLRPASPSDNDFLLHVYARTRQGEMASWGWGTAQQSSFVRMQYDARKHGYDASYPSSETSVISIGDVPAGSIIIFRSSSEIRLVDIALLPEFRSRGIGGVVIRMLISEADDTGSALRLSVLRSNQARHLYERLGFIVKGGDEMYCEMECVPARTQARGNVANTSPEKDPHAGKSE